MKDYYKAPWGKLLYITSFFGTAVLAGIPLCALFFSTVSSIPFVLIIGVLPITILAGCLFYTVKGFSFQADTLVVHRLLWDTRIPLNRLESVEFRSGAVDRSLRTFGNGGLFGFYGKYWSNSLGHFNAYITDFSKTVVLNFEDHCVVVSPEHPEEFVTHIESIVHIGK